jgi:hypothetical protein
MPVLIALAKCADDQTLIAYPCAKEIARMTEANVKTVFDALSWLKSKGIIVCVGYRETGNGRIKKYKLNLELLHLDRTENGIIPKTGHTENGLIDHTVFSCDRTENGLIDHTENGSRKSHIKNQEKPYKKEPTRASAEKAENAQPQTLRQSAKDIILNHAPERDEMRVMLPHTLPSDAKEALENAWAKFVEFRKEQALISGKPWNVHTSRALQAQVQAIVMKGGNPVADIMHALGKGWMEITYPKQKRNNG